MAAPFAAVESSGPARMARCRPLRVSRPAADGFFRCRGGACLRPFSPRLPRGAPQIAICWLPPRPLSFRTVPHSHPRARTIHRSPALLLDWNGGHHAPNISNPSVPASAQRAQEPQPIQPSLPNRALVSSSSHGVRSAPGSPQIPGSQSPLRLQCCRPRPAEIHRRQPHRSKRPARPSPTGPHRIEFLSRTLRRNGRRLSAKFRRRLADHCHDARRLRKLRGAVARRPAPLRPPISTPIPINPSTKCNPT